MEMLAPLLGFCCGVEQHHAQGRGPNDVIRPPPAAPSSYGSAVLDAPPRALSARGGHDARSAPPPQKARSLEQASAGARREAPPREDDARSEGAASQQSRSSAGSSSFEEMTREQKAEAKRIIKDFVKSMVKGKNLHVMLPTGQLRTVLVSLSRALDTLKIKAGANQNAQARCIPLASIDEILVGTDTGDSEACEGMETPLDELSVTLALSTQECITFRMSDLEARDTLVMCLTMFSNEARAKAGG